MKDVSTLNPEEIVPSTLRPGDRLGFKVVAVIGHKGDWLAHKGLTSWTDEQIVYRGIKPLTFFI